MALGAFQSSAFQNSAFQVDNATGGSAGHDDEAFIEVYGRFRDRNEEKLENIPKKVIDVIKDVATTNNKDAREDELKAQIDELELRFREGWLVLANQLHSDLVDRQIKQEMSKDLKRRNRRAIMLLLM